MEADMNTNTEVLIQLLSKAIRGQTADNIDNITDEMINWDVIHKEAIDHQVHTLLFPIISRLPEKYRPDSKLMILWQKETLLEASAQIAHMDQMSRVLNRFHSESVMLVALKGMVLRSYYPNPELRSMGDADLLVQEKDMKKAIDLLRSMGYKKGETGVKHTSFEQDSFPEIELHWALTTKEGKENLLTFTSEVWNNLIETHIGDAPVLTLSVENQLLHLLLHSVSHMISAGFGLRQLCDVVLFVEANKDVISWDVLLSKTADYNIDIFARTLLVMCKKYFNLDIPTAITTSIDEYYIDLLLEDIVNAGVFGRRSNRRDTSDRVSKYINLSDTSCKYASVYNIFLFLFPPAKKLGYHYNYACKYPFLLPIAWIHRAFHNLKRLDSLRFPMDKTIEATSKERAKLLHWLQLR
jgi:hypothetical protein